jgi:hypothetical protein
LLHRGALLLAAGLTSSAALAQTISVTPANGGCLGPGTGQSFRATLTGTVVAISVQPAGNTAGVTLHIYGGDAGSGQPGNVGTPVYSQAGINLVSVPAGTWQTISLTTPFPVVAGSSYSFALTGAIALRCNAADPYPSGTLITAFVGGSPSFDLGFQIFEVIPVPTLSEWALILLAGSLGLAGAAAVWRRHRV